MKTVLFLALTLPLLAETAKPVALSGKASLRTGTVLREKRQILVEKGSATLQNAKGEKRSVSTRWMQRFNLVRRLTGNGAEDIEVREHVQEEVQYPLGGMVPGPGENRGTLGSRQLRARPRAGSWVYELRDAKPAKADEAALLDLAFFANLMEIVPAALHTQVRKPGESWKPSIPAPRGKAYGIPVFKDVEATFGSIEERADGPHAKLFISGSFTMERPMNMLARLEVTFGIALTRRLSDHLDVETTIQGNFKNTLQVKLEDGAAGTMIHEYPYAVTRTITIEP